MSVAKVAQAPLHLSHDASPKDWKSLEPSRGEIMKVNNRYRGFINDFMMSPRAPITTSAINRRKVEEARQIEGLRQSTKKGSLTSKLYSDEGVLYGSDNIHRSKPGPRPFQGILVHGDRTAADMNKFQEQRMEAEMDIQRYKQDKIQKLLDREEEKKMDLEMLQNYHPWGKPGGGAPSSDSKMHKMDEHDMNDLLPTQMDDYFTQFGKPGAGAPNRTSSGSLRTSVKGDALIRFQNPPNAGGPIPSAIEPIRYNNGDISQQKANLSREYEHQIQEKAMKESEDRLSNLQKELEMLKYDPYGKPGAGAPNSRSNSDTVLAARRKAEKIVEQEFHPWGKGYGNPHKDDGGLVRSQKHRHTHRPGILEINTTKEENCGTGLVLSKSLGGAGDPVRSISGKRITKFPITMRKDNFGNTTTKEMAYNPFKTKKDLEGDGEYRRSADDPQYYPFGKPGAGAPLKDEHGRSMAHRRGNIDFNSDNQDPEMKQAAAHQYLMELKDKMYEQQQRRKAIELEEKTPIGDFTTVVKQGKVGNPRRDPHTGLLVNHHLGTSDVTKLKKENNMKDKISYHNDLVKAAEERQRQKALEKEQNIREEIQHEQHWTEFWGRPGGGAPKATVYNKHKFENILHKPDSDKHYIRNTTEGIAELSPRHFQKNYVQSTHENLYEVQNTRRNMQRRDYNISAPYATI